MGNVLGVQVRIRHKIPWLSSAGAKGTVTMMIGSRRLQILETGPAMSLKRVDPMWRMLYTPLTNAIALDFVSPDI